MTDLQIQCILRYLGYDPGPTDGISGKKTKDAVESFQRDNGLQHDRIFGKLTEEKVRYNFNHDIFKPVQVVETDLAPVQNNVQAAGKPDIPAENNSGFWKEIRYFTRREFRCPCGKWCNGYPVEPQERLVRFLDQMRGNIGVEMIIVPPDGHSGGSGIRCRQYNATFSNSAGNSTHLEGRAADFSAPGASTESITRYLSNAKAQGKIAYWYQINERSFHVNI